MEIHPIFTEDEISWGFCAGRGVGRFFSGFLLKILVERIIINQYTISRKKNTWEKWGSDYALHDHIPMGIRT